MNLLNKIFFPLTIIMQIYVLAIYNVTSTLQESIFILLYTIFSYFKPLWSLSILFAILPLFSIEFLQIHNINLTDFSASIILGIYTNLLIKHPVRLKRFLIKLRFTSIIIILIFLYSVTLLFGLIGQPLYSLFTEVFILNNPYILVEFLNVSPTSVLYPLKATFNIFESIFIGIYLFGILKHSNQIKIIHHLLLALVLGLIFSFFLVYFFHIESSLYSQYLIITLPLLPVILLLHKMNKFYFTLIVSLLLIGSVILVLFIQFSALITYPFIMLIIWIMIHFIIIRIKHKQETLKHFLKYNWYKIFSSFILTIFITLLISFSIKTIYNNNDVFIKDSINVYLNKQAKRDEILSLSKNIFLLNPIYGTGFGSFKWKIDKLEYQNTNKNTFENLYLEIIIGSGLIGLMFFISFLGLIFYKLLKKEFSKRSISIELSILILMTFTSLLSSVIYANVSNIFNFYPIMLIFWLLVFTGISLTHSYRVIQTQKFRAKKFFQYTSYILLYFLIIHILNFTIIKEGISYLITQKISFFKEDHIVILVSYLLVIMVIGIVTSFVIHSKIIFYSNNDDFFTDTYGEKKPHAIHKTAIARAGGIGIYITNLFLIFNPIGWKLLLISLPTFGIGLMDDIKSVTPKTRLILQAISAILSVLFLNTLSYSIGFEIMIPLWLSITISFISILGVTNAMNLIDGFNGLSSGIALMVFSSLAIISLNFNDMVLFEIIVINIIALIGFLILNFPKGKIFLGDGGAYFIGFSLANVALIMINLHKDISVFYPLAILIYPIWEVIFSIYRRKIIKKVKSTHADNLHLHQLIYKRITKNNPKTSIYVWKRIVPFIVLTTLFYNNDIVLLFIIFVFIIYYNFLYHRIVNFFN